MVRNKTNDGNRTHSTDRNKLTQPYSATKMIPLCVMRQQYDYIYLKRSKIAATNDVGDDGIVDGSSAITKTMKIQFGSSGGKFKFIFGHGFPPCKRILWICCS